uniref:Uncharacterized protein n=1 Tax=viral metagenome TaxID=1070528 RepID=A0A6C0F094_9ZZZZ
MGGVWWGCGGVFGGVWGGVNGGFGVMMGGGEFFFLYNFFVK